MAESCHTCGKTYEDVALSYCLKCRSVAYCSTACQKKDFENHRQTCMRRDAAGTAPCDTCHNTERLDEIADLCVECGAITCFRCAMARPPYFGPGVSVFPPCEDCHSLRCDPSEPEYPERLQQLIHEKVDDPRRSQWLMLLGKFHSKRNEEKKAIIMYQLAASQGFSGGYVHIACIYMRKGEWDTVKEYLEKAAELDNVTAMQWLGREALYGHFICDGLVQEDHKRDPDEKKAYYWFRKGARLGDTVCCGHLGMCYIEGMGVEANHAKGFKWSLRGAEKGNETTMRQLAYCYEEGYGVEASDKEALKWLEKSAGDDGLSEDHQLWLEDLEARVADQAQDHFASLS